MCVGGLPMIAEIGIGGIEKSWINQMERGTIIEILMGMDLRGTRGTTDSRTEIGLKGITVDLTVITDGISPEIGVRVTILIEGTEDIVVD
ncbi:hypothetical protein TNCV_462751 [Trichonephila clavipes]|nr:hypothetical protein TNCV_462751 [Trichonephila clavipes]